MKEKIIELWKAGEEVLAFITARSIMTDKQLLDFCINSEINMANREHAILVLRLGVHSFDIYNNGWVAYDSSKYRCQCYIPKNEKCMLNNFRRWLTRIIGNKRVKK